MTNTITKEQYHQLVGAIMIARKHRVFLDALATEVGAILQEEEPLMGHSGDLCYGEESIDSWLALHKITLTPEQH